MNRPTWISIHKDHLKGVTELARQCSTAVVRERVLVSQSATQALRSHLEQVLNLSTRDGRSAQLKYVELLDICDFQVWDWFVETRAMMAVERQALYVPTMPMMVGALSDFYVCAQVDRDLLGVEILGFVRRSDLANADISANGLFATLPVEELRPFDLLPEALKEEKASDQGELRIFEEWRLRAERIIKGVSEVLAAEEALAPQQVERIAAGVRDDVWRVYGDRLPETGLEPLFDRLFRRFGIDKPVPAPPASEVAFQNRAEDQDQFASADKRAEFFDDKLSIGERVSLYRHLLGDEQSLSEHRRIRQAFDRASGGKHQTSNRRRERLKSMTNRSVKNTEIIPEGSREEIIENKAVEKIQPTPASPDDRNQASAPGKFVDIFDFRNQLIGDYGKYVKSFIQIRDTRIKEYVESVLDEESLWPEPLIQLNPSFAPGEWIDELVRAGALHQECSRIFRKDKSDKSDGVGLRLHRHQTEAIHAAQTGGNYVLTTGTGSGKSLAYIIPIVNHVLGEGSGRGIKAIVVYPMNALANSQKEELTKFLTRGYENSKSPVTFACYTGQEKLEEKERILSNPPDILLTNFVMLELILTRPNEDRLIRAAQGLRFLVLDELHTYRGRQGSDVALLVRRVRDRMTAGELQCVGTSATIAGKGSLREQQEEVALVASQIFGAEVKSESVISETLQRATPERDFDDPEFRQALRESVAAVDFEMQKDYAEFVKDPLAVWIESTFGVKRDQEGRLTRSEPRSIRQGFLQQESAAEQLNRETGVDLEQCAQSIQRRLLSSYGCSPHPITGQRPFAFRLHQFISRGDMVYATLEDEDTRHLTVYGQQYRAGSRQHVLVPMIFCRECGQEYYLVRRTKLAGSNTWVFQSRELRDLQKEKENQPGFLYLNSNSPWPEDPFQQAERLPDEFVEPNNGQLLPRRESREDLPQRVFVDTEGKESEDGLSFSFIGAPFRFCLNCRVSYNAHQRDDFAKLAPLGSEGRSTATTILSLSAIRHLRRALPDQRAQKLLSFTDNRQDASLQAGHFNDFIETTLLRCALYRAVLKAGSEGIAHEIIPEAVFDALNLPISLYAANPQIRFQALKDTERALREMIGYRLYRDLRRGWRITAPNLEQCGLLEITYESLADACAAEDLWANRHETLAAAAPEVRSRICKDLLDYMRRELAINVIYLDSSYQERIRQQSYNHLISPWSIDENERMEFASILFPRSRTPRDKKENVFLSPRGGFGQHLRREFRNAELSLDDRRAIILDLLSALQEAGLVSQVVEPRGDDDVPGYQLQASGMRWLVGDGAKAFHDRIRVPNAPEEGSRTNQFFVDFYRSIGEELPGLEAREHTAQVEYDKRLEREQKFRSGELPILYCSPTMELGVDIAELNVVNMRNIPPTPANYAQRSGRAGRSGQPALVFTYCTTGSPHDQFFFKRPDRMVSGKITPPRLDLSNEDLLRAHIHAIWLAETGVDLGRSLKDILDVEGLDPSLELIPEIQSSIDSNAAKQRARVRAAHLMQMLQTELGKADWFSVTWLDDALNQSGARFNSTLNRWRDLYRAAMNQARIQDDIIRNASRSPQDKRQAEALRSEAERQLRLLTEIENPAQSDFYSYRYFASEGFLPGYNFPRLPISAYIPGRKGKQRDESYLSRPRFLAIAEFGPRAVVYHEGSRYVVNRVILPVGDRDGAGVPTSRAKLCPECGYLHPVIAGEGLDLCERCGATLDRAISQLFRMQSVSARRRDKISSDEEERRRLGYELITAVRFAEYGGQFASRVATLEVEGQALFRMTYGAAATLWRINKGERRRRYPNQLGFVLDVERGFWAKESQAADDPEEINDDLSPNTTRVVPFVEDTRNCLLLEPMIALDVATMASLQSALKNAIQVRYQLEDNELAAEPLPDTGNRRLLLFYESAEGGAGVLRRLIDEPEAISQVAEEALRLCHFDTDGSDLGRAPNSREDCEAACYDCLMSYYNQMEHRILDRKLIRDLLLQMWQARVISSPVAASRGDHFTRLLSQCDSELEKQWLHFLNARGYQLPSLAQMLISSCQTRPDFVYEDERAAIYVDGPHHDYPNRQSRDLQQTESLEDQGYTVIRFGHASDWGAILNNYPSIFGAARRSDVGQKEVSDLPVDLDLYEARWHDLLLNLAKQLDGVKIEPGEDVMRDGRVIGSYFALVSMNDKAIYLVAVDEPAAEQIREALVQQGFQALLLEADRQAEMAPEILRVLTGR